MDPDLVIPDRSLSILDGAIVTMGSTESWSMQHLEAMGKRYGFRVNVPVNKLRKEELSTLLSGSSPDQKRPKATRFHHWYNYDQWEGILPQLERRYMETDSEYMKEWYSRYMSNQKCPSCNGERFKPEILGVTINEKSILGSLEALREAGDPVFLEP